MKNPHPAKGSCLCGAVRIQALVHLDDVTSCHCKMCQKWGSLFAVQGDSPEFEGEENISIYKSSEWAERGFCKQCGSHLFYRLKDHSFTNFPPDLFGDLPFEFKEQIFFDQKPSFYSFANPTPKLTEAQTIQRFLDN